MDFLSLPENFQLQILKELDWKSLVNLKLVCRSLYFTIERNIEHLDRPKLGELEVICKRGKVKRLDYTLKNSNSHILETQRKIYFAKNKEQYNRFLKERDFTEVERLELFKEWICDCSANEYYKHIKKENVVLLEINPHEFEFDGYHFNICEDVETIGDITFDQYGVERRFITIGTLSDAGWRKICYDSCIKPNSLQELGFFEENGSKLIAVKLVMAHLTSNPNFNYNNVSTDRERPLHMEISECLFKYNYFNFEGRCNRKEIYFIFGLDFPSFSDFEKNFYREIFDKVKFGNNFEEFNGDFGSWLIETTMNCRKCGKKHLNRALFAIYESQWEILLK
uniref:F-box domain-containing protein n=1 Tax=Strongyloides papillosus TaxID=174720 RepID=A0A0N5B770_STREA